MPLGGGGGPGAGNRGQPCPFASCGTPDGCSQLGPSHGEALGFQGKLSFSPPVPELSDQGFPLAGARLDVIGGKPVAALVYQRRQHVINVLISSAPATNKPVSSKTIDGFHLLQWQNHGMAYSVVSDLNEPELRAFASLQGWH